MYVILIHQRYRQTDRQTTCNLKTALGTIVYIASRGKNHNTLYTPNQEAKLVN